MVRAGPLLAKRAAREGSVTSDYRRRIIILEAIYIFPACMCRGFAHAYLERVPVQIQSLRLVEIMHHTGFCLSLTRAILSESLHYRQNACLISVSFPDLRSALLRKVGLLMLESEWA